MATSRHSQNWQFPKIRLLDLAVAFELLLLILIYSNTFSFYPGLRSIGNQLALAIPVMFILPALYTRTSSALITVGVALIIVAYQILFVMLWHTPFTGESFGAFQGLLLTAMLAVHARDRDPTRILTIFFIVGLLFLLFYIYLYHSVDARSISIAQSRGDADFASAIKRTHAAQAGDTRFDTYKISISGALTSFMTLFSLSFLLTARTQRLKWIAAGVLILSLYVLWIADSRFNTAIVMLASLSMLIPLRNKLKSWIAFWIAVTGMVLYILAAAAGYNIFQWLAFDQSGAIRSFEFATANPVLRSTPFLGIGLWNSGEDWNAVFLRDNVYPSDLGWYGTLLQHGIVGIGLMLLCYFMMVRLVHRLTDIRAPQISVRLLTAYLMYLAFVQLLTTQAWEGAGAIFISLTFAYLYPGVKPIPRQHRQQPNLGHPVNDRQAAPQIVRNRPAIGGEQH